MNFVKLLFSYYVWPDDGLIEINKKAETCCHSLDFQTHNKVLLCFDLHYLISFVIPMVAHTMGMNHLKKPLLLVFMNICVYVYINTCVLYM
jgi:hypothetical protein